jgi:molybdopterin-guanine dinucleotide biosynthesis protein A
MTPTAAIVLAGGRGARLGGADKAAVDIDGLPLVDHVYRAVAGLPIIAVGPDSLARPGVRVVRERPPFGGPVAALAAGLAALPATVEQVWLLSCDLPRAGAVVALLSAAELRPGDDGVVPVDTDGRPQWLAGRYRTGPLRAAMSGLGDPAGASMRALLTGLSLFTVPDDDGAALDLDTWDAIEDYRRREHG